MLKHVSFLGAQSSLSFPHLPSKPAAFSAHFLIFKDYLGCSLGKYAFLRFMEIIRKDYSPLFE